MYTAPPFNVKVRHNAVILITMVMTLGATSAYSETVPDKNRQAELRYLVQQDCGSCHGMRLKGGLGPALLPNDIRNYSVIDLATVILNGRPLTPMPPWKGILSKVDAIWIAQNLKAGELAQHD